MRRSTMITLALGLAFGGVRSASAQSVYVTTYEDYVDFGGSQQVSNLPGPDGKVSLREAVVAANKTPGPQTIGFQIPPSEWGLGAPAGPQLWNQGSPWVVTDDGLTVDGTTQTAFTGDTNPVGHEVGFLNVHPSYLGSTFFAVYADGCTFRGLDQMANRAHGIALYGDGNTVVGNRIWGAISSAVLVEGNDNQIGGALPGAGNDLSSGGGGLLVRGTATGNRVHGNFLHGTVHGALIQAGATANHIGGLAPGEGNWIADVGYFGEHGIRVGALIALEASGNFLRGNRLGTDDSGTFTANVIAPVGLQVRHGSLNVIEGNVIGGLTAEAIVLNDGSSRNTIRANYIGVDATGQFSIGNGTGILISGFDFGQGQDVIANVVDSNVIRYSAVAAVSVQNGQRVARANEITRNSIFDNVGIGIELGATGRNPNDPGDADQGPNDLMNHPVLSSAVSDGVKVVVNGAIDTVAPATTRIELFAGPPPFGTEAQGVTYLGAALPTPNGSFTAVVAAAAPGDVVTATATDAQGNTSEFSLPAVVSGTAYVDLGQAIAGQNGLPQLIGVGTLAVGTATTLTLSNAASTAPGLWVIGGQTVYAPIPGGVLVPKVDLTWPIFTGGTGSAQIGGTIPSATLSGLSFWVQALILDAGAAQGIAASSALRGTIP